MICKLKDIYKALYNFEKEFAEKNGITINEGMILCCLQDNECKTAQEICEFVGLSNSRVSRVINSVENKGLILRSMGTQDKRQMIFQLSETGKRKFEEIIEQENDFQELSKHINTLLY